MLCLVFVRPLLRMVDWLISVTVIPAFFAAFRFFELLIGARQTERIWLAHLVKLIRLVFSFSVAAGAILLVRSVFDW